MMLQMIPVDLLANSNIEPTMEEPPKISVSFDSALRELSQFCRKNNYFIYVQNNGNISFEIKK